MGASATYAFSPAGQRSDLHWWDRHLKLLKIPAQGKIVARLCVGAGLKPALRRITQNGQVSNLPLQPDSAVTKEKAGSGRRDASGASLNRATISRSPRVLRQFRMAVPPKKGLLSRGTRDFTPRNDRPGDTPRTTVGWQ
jgi:hypothetical protein